MEMQPSVAAHAQERPVASDVMAEAPTDKEVRDENGSGQEPSVLHESDGKDETWVKSGIKKRFGRQWHKYCQTLPRHIKAGAKSSNIVELERSGRGASQPRHVEKDHEQDSHRRTGLPADQRCSFWFEQKKRLCSRPRIESSSFCLWHQDLSQTHSTNRPDTSAEARECELCKAKILNDRYESHLKRCNVRTRAEELLKCPYFKQDANSGSEVDELPAELLLDDTTDALAFMELIDRGYEVYVKEIPERVKQSLCCNALFELAQAGGESRTDPNGVLYKHLKQDSSLISNMEDKGLLAPDTDCTFVEFGAGKAMLSLSLVQCNEAVNLILIERESGHMKGKADRILRLRPSGAFQRLTVDIRHLDLRAVSYNERMPTLQSVVGISKHLCGVATDLALRCLVNYQGAALANEKEKSVKGICIALCCHHLCNWNDYVGKKFFIHELKIGRRGFEKMCKYASWATGCRQHIVGKDQARNSEVKDPQTDSNQHDFSSKPPISRQEKVGFGRKCKRLIDVGRMLYVREHLGLECELSAYVAEDLTPENVMLIAS